MIMQTVIDANQGRSEIGGGSRFNAVKHGLTARTPVLPNEDPEALEARIEGFKESLQTSTPLEDDLATRAAEASWRLDRANRAEVARATLNIVTGPDAAAFKEQDEVYTLAERLFGDRRGPAELHPTKGFENSSQPRTSKAEVVSDPDHPARLVLRLESTLAGCRFLQARWTELKELIELGIGWDSPEKLRAVRLLGHQPMSLIDNSKIRKLFLACHVMAPQNEFAFQELRCEIEEPRFNRLKVALCKRDMSAITPADTAAAQAALLVIVDKALKRLRRLKAKRREVAGIVEKLQPDILGHDDSKGGHNLRRHVESTNKLIHRNIEVIYKRRRDEATGWGKTRQERERRKGGGIKDEGGILTCGCDLRLVMDEEGMVHVAQTYKGNLEEGLARHREAFQPKLEGAPVRCLL